jgi:hypothetical protein
VEDQIFRFSLAPVMIDSNDDVTVETASSSSLKYRSTEAELFENLKI